MVVSGEWGIRLWLILCRSFFFCTEPFFRKKLMFRSKKCPWNNVLEVCNNDKSISMLRCTFQETDLQINSCYFRLHDWKSFLHGAILRIIQSMHHKKTNKISKKYCRLNLSGEWQHFSFGRCDIQKRWRPLLFHHTDE